MIFCFQIEDDNRKAHVKFRKENPIFYEQVAAFSDLSTNRLPPRSLNCCRGWRQLRRMCTSRAPTASTSPGRRVAMVGRAAGNEEAGRRKEAVGKVEGGNGGTASRRGGKGDLALEVGNMQLTSRLARSLESQVIILCRPISSLLKHDFLMTLAIESKGTLNIK